MQRFALRSDPSPSDGGYDPNAARPISPRADVFEIYIARVKKAAILLRRPTDWLTPVGRSVARAIRNAQDLSSQFRNYLMADDLLRLPRAGDLITEFGHAAFPRSYFPMRGPSGTFRMRMAGDFALFTEFPPLRTQCFGGGAESQRFGFTPTKIPMAEEYEAGLSFATPLPMVGFAADGAGSMPGSPNLAADFSAGQCLRPNSPRVFRWQL